MLDSKIYKKNNTNKKQTQWIKLNKYNKEINKLKNH